jgi:phosphate:Na+ symporter
MAEILGNLMAGTGLFFVGLRMITTGLKQMAGRRLRMVFARWTDARLRTGLIGLLCGLIFQSMSGVSFIVASLIVTGILIVRRALPIIFWANAGASLLVLVAVLDVKVFFLFALGLAGLALAFEKPARYQPLASALFGIGMVFYGLAMLRTGATPLVELKWFEAALLQVQRSFFVAFLISALLAVVARSASAVTILAITFTQAGLLSAEQTFMIIYGANLGSGIITWILAAGLKGKPKQVVMSQVLFNAIGSAVFVSLFCLEVYAGIPLVRALIRRTSAPLEYQMVCVHLLFNWGSAAALSLATRPIARLLDRLWPPTQEETWSEMRFLHDQALRDPETALSLLDREQSRLFGQLPLYVQELRKVISGNGNPAYESIHGAFQTVAREIEAFAAELFRQAITAANSEKALNVQNRQKLLEGLEEVVRELVLDLDHWVSSNGDATVRDAFVEALDTLLLTACDAADSKQTEDIELLIKITQDRGELLKAMRQNYMAKERGFTSEGRQLFLRITGRFETAVWVLSRVAQLQRQTLLIDEGLRN